MMNTVRISIQNSNGDNGSQRCARAEEFFLREIFDLLLDDKD